MLVGRAASKTIEDVPLVDENQVIQVNSIDFLVRANTLKNWNKSRNT